MYLYVSRHYSGRKDRIGEPTSLKLPLNDVPEFHTHDWVLGWCKICNACFSQSADETYFYSNVSKWRLDIHAAAEYPISCKDNTIKQVIQ